MREDRFTWKDGDVTVTYEYGRNTKGDYPQDGFLRIEEDETGRFFDILIYSRPLTLAERKQYDLVINI